ncbi:AfsR/SARP family transcriptional regulator [Kribbella qitaiheensis]|uniref:AfsR/SARP family transcriptional regulator n=1 Tax=Kribbella qitaiheensis TaxID=1544730 RepID=A0A7G6X7T4_9ACTN|nr:AfsR/SARP family transcriptional regulator [Kribbella qitaiheensis]
MTAQLRFGLLGPLEVRAPAGLIPLRAGKLRVILAALLLQPARPVSIDELIDRLWGDEPVGTARATVHQYVMRLRQTLGDAGGADLIQTAPDGYLIEVAAEAIDVHRFDDLVRRGREQGDLASEARSLAEALALWRGAALADIPSQWLQLSEVPRLHEQRLQVIERRIEVELLLGRYPGVIAELRALTHEHPLREAYWLQLIEALHAAGRPAEALAAFQQVRQVMDDELGVAPGPRLRELQAAIIAESHASGTAPPSVESEPVPRQLPPDIVTFAGRTAELEMLVAALDNRSGPPAGARGGCSPWTWRHRQVHPRDPCCPRGHRPVPRWAALCGPSGLESGAGAAHDGGRARPVPPCEGAGSRSADRRRRARRSVPDRAGRSSDAASARQRCRDQAVDAAAPGQLVVRSTDY